MNPAIETLLVKVLAIIEPAWHFWPYDWRATFINALVARLKSD